MGAGNTRLDLMPYVGGIQYTGTAAKDRSTIAGLYGYYGIGMEHSIEADVGWTRIDYDFGTLSRIDQYDATLVYSNYGVLDWKWRLGGHLVTSTDEPTEGGVLFGGFSNYEPTRFNRGVDLYFSHYGQYIPTLDIQQVTGTWGFYLKRLPGTYLKVQGHYIHLSDDIGFGQQHFGSGELTLVQPIQDWTLTFFGWAGRQAFAVQRDGFVVYNLPEEHRAAYGGSLRYQIATASSIKLEFIQKHFQELAASASARASQLLLFWQQTF
jgi:hypothetical protein